MRTRIAATVAALAAAVGIAATISGSVTAAAGSDHGASVTSDTHVLAGRSNTAH